MISYSPVLLARFGWDVRGMGERFFFQKNLGAGEGLNKVVEGLWVSQNIGHVARPVHREICSTVNFGTPAILF